MARSADVVSAALKKVPPFPPVAAKLLQLLTNPSVDLGEVAELVSTDATFTARLLQRVNSAQFSLASPVTNIKQCVAFLGIDLTRHVIVSHATAAYVEGALGTQELRRCWEHTVATAVLAEEVAHACELHTQAAFTAGIMHDIGRLGLLVAYPADYERVIRDSAARCIDLLDFEEQEFGLDHAAAGRILAEQWGLPTELGVAAGRHHDPPDGSGLDLLQIVHVACQLADALGYDVVSPLKPVAVSEILSALPVRAQERLSGDGSALRTRIDEEISRYSSAEAAPPPEESLALLAPLEAEPEVAVEPASEAPVIEEPEEEPKKGREGRWAAVAFLVLGAIALAVLLLWRFVSAG